MHAKSLICETGNRDGLSCGYQTHLIVQLVLALIRGLQEDLQRVAFVARVLLGVLKLQKAKAQLSEFRLSRFRVFAEMPTARVRQWNDKHPLFYVSLARPNLKQAGRCTLTRKPGYWIFVTIRKVSVGARTSFSSLLGHQNENSRLSGVIYSK